MLWLSKRGIEYKLNYINFLIFTVESRLFIDSCLDDCYLIVSWTFLNTIAKSYHPTPCSYLKTFIKQIHKTSNPAYLTASVYEKSRVQRGRRENREHHKEELRGTERTYQTVVSFCTISWKKGLIRIEFKWGSMRRAAGGVNWKLS